MQRLYLWVFFKWLQSIASQIVLPERSVPGRLMEFRQMCKTGSRKGRDLLDSNASLDLELFQKEMDCVAWDTLLYDFEQKLFYSSKENQPNIVNVYARKENKSNSDSDDPLKPLRPSSSVKRTGKEFIAEVLSVSYHIS